MYRRCVVFLCVLAMVNVNFAVVSGWGNGGFSDLPSNPKYGTHDWVAEHALDWLPMNEKQFILDNINWYLYGTELPDNGDVSDGIGDRSKHHVYYFANGSLQEPDAAVRAQAEYDAAVDFFNAGDFANASKMLGVVSHYISDLAVFGHVMGNRTEWGNATNHDKYEDHVDSRTDSYIDEFNVFLAFDGSLDAVSAFDAALALAYDTTFDGGGVLNCTWMEGHYNWSDSAFCSRCGESLNLAVNLVADVLHTFYGDVVAEFSPFTIIPLFIILTTVVVLWKRKGLGKSCIG